MHVKNDFKFDKVITNISELTDLLSPRGVIERITPGHYRINKSLSIDENIRVDITSDSVKKIELRSSPNDVLCLCFEDSEVLIKGIEITSYNPVTSGPDTEPADQRSFIRALKSARMDVLDSRVTYLGNGIMPGGDSRPQIQKEGGTYGISWRIPDDMLGVDVATGWVENNLFYKNFFGSYSYGTSGMTWRNNHYLENDVYGLDPHDDSNSALVENNVFERNGKHGFIASKRCNYNIIRNNTSLNNGLHGFMLHQDSAYNLMENNVSYGNTDNFAVFASDFNTIRNNTSYNARSSHIRINEGSKNSYISDNTLVGGKKGVYVYGKSENVAIRSNIISGVKDVLTTEGATNVLFSGNTIGALSFRLNKEDRLIYGSNTVNGRNITVPNQVPFPDGFTTKK